MIDVSVNFISNSSHHVVALNLSSKFGYFSADRMLACYL